MISFISLISAVCFGATIRYTFKYDDSGNRIKRDTVTISLKNKNTSLDSAAIYGINDNIATEQFFEEKLNELSILVYPNPTRGLLKISIPNRDKETVRLQLYSLQGILITDKKMDGNLNEVDLSGKPSGMYILKIFVNGKESVWKIIKD